jgi:hypothetical protein
VLRQRNLPIGALVPSDDERAAALQAMGAEVVEPTSPAPEKKLRNSRSTSATSI